jgi:septal ring factor EnvC (AmiA/AmiB activator)
MRAILAVLTVVLAVATPSLAASKDPEADLRRVQRQIEQLQKSVREDVARRDKLSAALREAEERVGEARGRLDAARRRVRESDRRIGELAAERAREEARLDAERDALAAELRAAYVTGREEHLKLLLSQKDPAALGRMLVYYSYFGQARAGRIAAIEATVTRIEALAADEAAERERLAVLESERARELAALESARADREEALAGLNATIRSREDSIARLKQEAATLEKLIEDLRRALREAPAPEGRPFARVRGQLPWPVAGRIVARFGESRGGGLKWNGVLIATERGAEVRAPYAGRVVYADWLPGLGLLLIMDHGGGYMTLYGHNEQLYKQVGDPVAAGDVIAAVGDSGGQSRPELYLEVRKGTAAEDPRRWFRGAPR